MADNTAKKAGSEYILDNYKPEKGMIEITSCQVLAWKEIPVGAWIVGIFKRTEKRKARNKETKVLVFASASTGAEFALGESSVLQSALVKAGAIDGGEAGVDYKPIEGKTVAIQNKGMPEGKRYSDLRVFVRD